MNRGTRMMVGEVVTAKTVGYTTNLGGGTGASASLLTWSEAAAGIFPRSRLASAPVALAVIRSLSHGLGSILLCRSCMAARTR